MSAEIECRSCGNDLEQWNNGPDLVIKHCPFCGAKVLREQSLALYCKTTTHEISAMIRTHLLDVLSYKDGDDISADELAQAAWEAENRNGVMFYSNHEADRFVTRHLHWVNGAVEFVCDEFGDSEHYLKMRAGHADRFLVVAFITATERYLYDQLGIDPDEGDLSKERIAEIKQPISGSPYNGGW
jgi:predicted RNA-binding Zn-ribbon protein involved in translation (DUF1610 family)